MKIKIFIILLSLVNNVSATEMALPLMRNGLYLTLKNVEAFNNYERELRRDFKKKSSDNEVGYTSFYQLEKIVENFKFLEKFA